MPLIEKQDHVERVELKVKIRPDVFDQLQKYASFADSEEWYCVQELLRKAMSLDKEFQAQLGNKKPKTTEAKPTEVAKKGVAA